MAESTNTVEELSADELALIAKARQRKNAIASETEKRREGKLVRLQQDLANIVTDYVRKQELTAAAYQELKPFCAAHEINLQKTEQIITIVDLMKEHFYWAKTSGVLECSERFYVEGDAVVADYKIGLEELGDVLNYTIHKSSLIINQNSEVILSRGKSGNIQYLSYGVNETRIGVKLKTFQDALLRTITADRRKSKEKNEAQHSREEVKKWIYEAYGEWVSMVKDDPYTDWNVKVTFTNSLEAMLRMRRIWINGENKFDRVVLADAPAAPYGVRFPDHIGLDTAALITDAVLALAKQPIMTQEA